MSPDRRNVPLLLPDSVVVGIQTEVLRWGGLHFQGYPWRSVDDPYLGLVAEVLLQRTRAANVVPVFEEFRKRFPTPEALASTTLDSVSEVVRPLGLLWRIPLLHQLGHALVDLGGVPDDLQTLLALPGIGPYSAAAYLSFHAGQRAVIIDSNVVRWIARITDQHYDAETRRRAWMKDAADRLTPTSTTRAYNYGVLDLTMQVCVPGKPKCGECPLSKGLCMYPVNLRDRESI